MPITPEAVRTWIAAIQEGCVAPATWVPWAEREVQAAAYVHPWLVDLFDAATPDQAQVALHRGLDGRADWPLVHASLRNGFLWLLHGRG